MPVQPFDHIKSVKGPMTAAVLTLKDPWVGYYTTSPPAPSLPTSHLSLEETSEKEMCPQRSLCVLLFSFRRVVFSSSLSPPRQRYSPQGGSLGTWQHIKREGSWPRVGIWLQPDFGHGLRLIGAVKRTRVCVCVWANVFVWVWALLKVWKHIKDKCQTTVCVEGIKG